MTTHRNPFKPQTLFLVLFALVPLICMVIADSTVEPLVSHAFSSAEVHIIYTEKPNDEDIEAFHIQILSAVLGSEEAAKKAMLYSYKSAACAFSAKLTPEQVAQISKLPGVRQVVPSRMYLLNSGSDGPQ
ncbi:subtilisin-like protease SBT3.9 [Gastrolobium bilobum]|uniref:subtilisin-like protease SBT3.9 n=1 Tax=Gastrolobium bilobum TaxID=150636 RepID=UPI002AB11251|nr:subtilisin-like protease SBT3.9 [Gastrolobium bilobum]